MSITSIPATPGSTATAAELAQLNQQLGASGGQKTLGQSDFLNLLVSQLQNQDPLQPMQDTQFISEMANFSSLQQMTTLTSDFNTFTSNDLINQAQGYLGKQVTVYDFEPRQCDRRRVGHRQLKRHPADRGERLGLQRLGHPEHLAQSDNNQLNHTIQLNQGKNNVTHRITHQRRQCLGRL